MSLLSQSSYNGSNSHHVLFDAFLLHLMDHNRMRKSELENDESCSVNYPSLFRNAVENLLGSLTRLTCVPERDIVQAENRLGVSFPKILRDYYASVGGIDEINFSHNHFLMPKECFVERNRLAFLQEQDEQTYWGIRCDRPNEIDLMVERGHNGLMHWMWKPEKILCSEFLLVHIHWQAVCGGMAFLATSSSSNMLSDELSKNWQVVGNIADLIAFCRPGLAACLIGEGSLQQVYLGARHEADILALVDEWALLGVNLVPFSG